MSTLSMIEDLERAWRRCLGGKRDVATDPSSMTIQMIREPKDNE